MNMRQAVPPFEWKWNPNTILFLIAIAGGVLAWGYAVARFENGIRENARDLQRMEIRVDRIETAAAKLGNHELRLSGVETDAALAGEAARETSRTVNGLVTDVRVIREIVQRIEAGQNGNRPAN